MVPICICWAVWPVQMHVFSCWLTGTHPPKKLCSQRLLAAVTRSCGCSGSVNRSSLLLAPSFTAPRAESRVRAVMLLHPDMQPGGEARSARRPAKKKNQAGSHACGRSKEVARIKHQCHTLRVEEPVDAFHDFAQRSARLVVRRVNADLPQQIVNVLERGELEAKVLLAQTGKRAVALRRRLQVCEVVPGFTRGPRERGSRWADQTLGGRNAPDETSITWHTQRHVGSIPTRPFSRVHSADEKNSSLDFLCGLAQPGVVQWQVAHRGRQPGNSAGVVQFSVWQKIAMHLSSKITSGTLFFGGGSQSTIAMSTFSIHWKTCPSVRLVSPSKNGWVTSWGGRHPSPEKVRDVQECPGQGRGCCHVGLC